MQRAVLHEQRCDRAAVLVEPRFEDAALARAVRVGLELLHLGRQDDGLEQLIDAHAGLRGDLADLRLAAPLGRGQTVLGQLGEDAVGVRAVLIHLVDGHDDGDLGRLGVVDGLDGLRHDAVVRGDDENGDIGAHRAARAHLGKGRVARGIEEGDGLAVDFDGVSADVLRDAAGLAGRDLRVADIVEQGRLAVVDVAHDDHDRRTGDELVGGILMIVEQTLLDGDDDLVLDLAAKLSGDEFRRVKVDGLVDRGHDAVFEQALDDLGRRLLHAGGQLADGDLIGDLDDQLRLLGDLELESAHLLLLLGAGLGAEALGLLLLFVLVADLLLAALVILHAVGDQRIDAVVIAVGVDGDGAGVDDAALALALRLRLLGLLLGVRLLRTLRVLVVLVVLRLRRALEIVLLRARLLILLLRTRLIALRRRGRLILRGRCSGRGGCGSRRGRRSFLLCCGSGKDLLDRIDLVLLRDVVKDHVQLVFRQILGAAFRFFVEFPDDLDELLRRHRKIVCDFLDLLFHFNAQYSHLQLFLPHFYVLPVCLRLLPALLDPLRLHGQLGEDIRVGLVAQCLKKRFCKRRLGKRAQRAGVAAQAVAELVFRVRHTYIRALAARNKGSGPAEGMVAGVLCDQQELRLAAAAGDADRLFADLQQSCLAGKPQQAQGLLLFVSHGPPPPFLQAADRRSPAGSGSSVRGQAPWT